MRSENDLQDRLPGCGTTATDNPYRFSTKYHAPETGLYYYGCRYYNPELGRWLSRDPIGEVGLLYSVWP